MKTLTVTVTPKVAADVMRAQCGKEGKDIVEHLLEVMSNSSEILNLAFNSLDPEFQPEGRYEVGDTIYASNGDAIEITGIDRTQLRPIQVENGYRTYTAKEVDRYIAKYSQ